MINTCLQACSISVPGTVGRRNLNGNLGGASKKSKPFIIVQHPVAAATRKVLLLVVVVDGIAIAIQVIAKDWCLLAGVS